MIIIKYRVTQDQKIIGYEQVDQAGGWCHTKDGRNWKPGTLTGRGFRRWLFIGKQDKRGRDIYENDILRWNDWEQEGIDDWDRYLVKWVNKRTGLPAFQAVIYRDGKILADENEDLSKTEEFEVMATYAERPDLLNA